MANRGSHVAIAAPGVDILVAAPGESYKMESGTSFAAAFVSGVAALVLERKPQAGPDAVKKALLSTARDLGPKGRDDQFGAGLMDAYQAVSTVDKPADAALQVPAH
jgi:subtilisin family serine protease